MIEDMIDVGAWVRVSSGGQDEENQVPDIERHCAGRGYRIAKWYELNDKSASKGEQQTKLDEMLDGPRKGAGSSGRVPEGRNPGVISTREECRDGAIRLTPL